ncbi:MAG: GNAT family N-acetyltransferase [Thermoplasmataceae archaeon]
MSEFLELQSPSDQYFDDAIDIYREAFESTPEIYLDPKYFSQSSGRETGDMQWHFCVLIDKEPVGMAAFASTIFGGYGGYVAVREHLRNRGYGTVLLKNIMDTLISDSIRKKWNLKFLFAEYEDRNRKLWESKGFYTLPVEYFQPPLTEMNEWIKMNLGALPLTDSHNISGNEILNFVTFLYSKIYYLKDYAHLKEYQSMKSSCKNLVLSPI